MLWLLLALVAWTVLALLIGPVVGKVLALDGRPPRPRLAVRIHRPVPVQRIASRIG